MNTNTEFWFWFLWSSTILLEYMKWQTPNNVFCPLSNYFIQKLAQNIYYVYFFNQTTKWPSNCMCTWASWAFGSSHTWFSEGKVLLFTETSNTLNHFPIFFFAEENKKVSSSRNCISLTVTSHELIYTLSELGLVSEFSLRY